MNSTPPALHDRLVDCAIDSWSPRLADSERDRLCRELEAGKVLHLPRLAFALAPEEREFLSDRWAAAGTKNINLRPGASEVRGAQGEPEALRRLRAMLRRYAASAAGFLDALFPRYTPFRHPGGTSYRPCSVATHKLSWRRDDTRMHVDAFPSNPVRGRRILRVFSNVHPADEARSWRVGEPFEAHARHFLPRVRRPVPGAAWLLSALGITKSRRSDYDHLMLQLHDASKADAAYQAGAPRQAVDFAPGSSWIVFTDQVVHAALSGQYALEQTYYLEREALAHPELAPLSVLETLTGRRLVA